MKRRLEGMKHYERVSEGKKRRVESGNKEEAVRCLLELSEVDNGITYSEPYSGVFTMTDLDMNDLEDLEAD